MILLGDDLDENLRELLHDHHLDTVEGAMAFEGGQDLVKANLNLRRRTRLELTDRQRQKHTFYMKRYGRPGLWERLKSLLRGEWTSPARREFENIQAVRRAGVPTMRAIVCGQECPCGLGASYIIVSSVPGEALERCGQELLHTLAASNEVIANFTRQLASMVRSLHTAGMFHRDLYAAHVFADSRNGRTDLYLIDLARVIRPCCRTFRWRVKDLAQLKYSMPPEWVLQWREFMLAYLGDAATEMDRYNAAIDAKVEKINRHDANRRAKSEV